MINLRKMVEQWSKNLDTIYKYGPFDKSKKNGLKMVKKHIYLFTLYKHGPNDKSKKNGRKTHMPVRII